jgi:hypothetical protein
MSAARIAKVVFAVMWVLFTSASARAGSVPDAWSGIITLDWSSQLPENSPLRAEVDRIIVDAHTEWTMWVHFKQVSASDRKVEYTVQSATVDYLQISHHEARGRRGDAFIRTLQTERLEASGRTLDSRACKLVFWVDYAAKRYGIEVGGFKLEDVPRSGQVLIEVTDANGTRRVSDPATGDHDVIEPVRFQGRYSGGDPDFLEGTYDANVEPPPGVDLSYETVGGMVEWSLYRGACPDVEKACFAAAEILLSMCAGITQGIYHLDCDMDEIKDTCFDIMEIPPLVDGQPMPSPVSPRACVWVACKSLEGFSSTDSAFDAGIDDLMDCWSEYWNTFSDCDRLCP